MASFTDDLAHGTPRPDSTRIFVQLSSGTRILVPVPEQCSVRDLHKKALHRAAGFGVEGALEDTVLETTGGSNPPIALSGEDAVLDILDLTEDNTFSLRSVDLDLQLAVATGRVASTPGPSATPSPTTTKAAEAKTEVFWDVPSPAEQGGTSEEKNGSELVYVRWVTIDAAVGISRLSQIPVSDSAFDQDTSLPHLYRAATNLFCSPSKQRRGSCTNPAGLNLYLKECYLNAEKNPATLADLGLKGSYQSPLDIFVDFVGPGQRGCLRPLSEKSEPRDLWSFDSTNRGICTLVTSLQILLKEIDRGNCTVEGILKVLLELTHFPPVLLAFSHLYWRGIGEWTDADHFLLVASAFHALCRKFAPSWICPTSDTALESSRQLVAWIHSLHSTDKRTLLVYRVQMELIANGVPFQSATGYVHDMDVPFSSDSNTPEKQQQKQEEEDEKKKRIKVHVVLDEGDEELSRMLALAHFDKYSVPWDFYFRHPNMSWKEFLGHWLVPTIHQNEFHHLLETINSVGPFRIVGPQQLGSCLAVEIPVITLSAKGYVSRYDQEDYECGEKRFYIWNALEKKVILPDLDSGQFLSRELEPVIVERKKDQTWELDSWAEWNEAADFGTPDEAIVICVDTSSSMETEMSHTWSTTRDTPGKQPSRLTEVKEFFKNLTLRISALNLSTHIGLVTFSNEVSVQQPLTPLHLNIHQQLESISPEGITAIFDALSMAKNMLLTLKGRLPETKCRVILLTDGEDNKSTVLPADVSQALYDDDIVLDSVVIGTNLTTDLFKVSRMTGGYAFAPKVQQSLFQIFLLETVVDIRSRPDPIKQALEQRTWDTFSPKAPDMSTPYEFPPCKPHPHLDDYFIALGDAERFLNFLSRKPKPSFETVVSDSIRSSLPMGVSGSWAGAANSSSTRILMGEVKAMIDHPHDFMDVYVSESNMGFWKVVMQGPPDSPYENGVFLLYVEMGTEFPRKPPTARFVTPVLHPNITKHGRICHPIFDREWAPQTRVYQVLQHLYGILMSLEARDAIDPLSALRFWTDAAEGRREVESYVDRFASRTRAQLRAQIIGDDVSTIASGMSAGTVPSYHTDPGDNAPIAVGSDDDSWSVVSPRPPSYHSNASSAAGAGVGVGGGGGRGGAGATIADHLASVRRPLPGGGGRRASFFNKLRNVRS